MERWQKACIAALAAVVLGVGAFAIGYSLAEGDGHVPLLRGSDRGPAKLGIIHDALDKIESSSVEAPPREKLVRGALRGMVKVLKDADDPYALFYTPEGYRSFQELTTGRFSGIGVWLKEKDGDLEIVSVLPSTPAREAGLQRGDVIHRIDGEEVQDMTVDEAVARVKGPEGTDVSLTVRRGEGLLQFTITRDAIDLPNVVARMTEGNLAYVRLFGFAHGAGGQLRNEVERLRRQGADGIVLDLRDNGGGLFAEAVDVASVFIEDGEIVTVKHGSNPERVYEAEGEAFEEVPLVVLVNEGTASASEIVAGALKDRRRAIVIGERTYGKGSVQEVFPLQDASALKLTTGAYVTPSGRDINGEGIEPNVQVSGSARVQRRRAVEILRGIVISSSDSHG